MVYRPPPRLERPVTCFRRDWKLQAVGSSSCGNLHGNVFLASVTEYRIRGRVYLDVLSVTNAGVFCAIFRFLLAWYEKYLAMAAVGQVNGRAVVSLN